MTDGEGPIDDLEEAKRAGKEGRQYHPLPGDAADEVAADVELEEPE